MADAGTLLVSDIPKSYTPGDLTVATGEFKVFVDTLQLGAAETVTINGTATVVILG